MKEVIHLIEDDESLGKGLKTLLTQEGFEVIWSPSLAKARENVNQPIQLVILDWMLPDGQGLDLLKEWRQNKIKIPVIMLTAKAELIDKIVGLETGANDYMTKPFEPRELLARIRVQLRMALGPGGALGELEEEIVKIRELEIHPRERKVFFDGKEIEMTKMEYELLKLLAGSPGRVFPRDEILNKVWGYENYPTTRTVDTHVLQIRQKTTDDLIQTKRGVGYYLQE